MSENGLMSLSLCLPLCLSLSLFLFCVLCDMTQYTHTHQALCCEVGKVYLCKTMNSSVAQRTLGCSAQMFGFCAICNGAPVKVFHRGVKSELL